MGTLLVISISSKLMCQSSNRNITDSKVRLYSVNTIAKYGVKNSQFTTVYTKYIAKYLTKYRYAVFFCFDVTLFHTVLVCLVYSMLFSSFSAVLEFDAIAQDFGFGPRRKCMFW